MPGYRLRIELLDTIKAQTRAEVRAGSGHRRGRPHDSSPNRGDNPRPLRHASSRLPDNRCLARTADDRLPRLPRGAARRWSMRCGRTTKPVVRRIPQISARPCSTWRCRCSKMPRYCCDSRGAGLIASAHTSRASSCSPGRGICLADTGSRGHWSVWGIPDELAAAWSTSVAGAQVAACSAPIP